MAIRSQNSTGKLLTESMMRDSTVLNKIIDVQKLNEEDRKQIMTTLDALLRDAKARKAYA